MESAALLDLLGNKNRRRILQLLARKPCYVTEISEYLGVSPKAVIDHLRKLEEAGVVESRVDERRRKYFNITRSLRLEVNVSPYGYGAKSAYAANAGLDMSTCEHLSVNVTRANGNDPATLATEIVELQELEHELSLAQRWVQGYITDRLDRLADQLGVDEKSRLYFDVIAAIGEDVRSTTEIARRVDVPAEIVEEVLRVIEDGGAVEYTGNGWTIPQS